MRVLLDNCVPLKFGRLLPGHEVVHCSDLGWERLTNGKLLDAAEANGFPVMVTVDRNMQFQQRLTGRHLTVVYLRVPSNSIAKLTPLADEVGIILGSLQPGTVMTINHPDMR